MVKRSGGQRKSDGVVVPLGPVGQHNPPGGKGPDFDLAGNAGTRKGMAGTARSNNPCRPQSVVIDLNRLAPVGDDVRRLQRTLWAAAKQSSDRRFHALFDRIARGDVLAAAWKRVRANKGAAGVDKQKLADVGDYGVDRLLGEIAVGLRAGTYRPAVSRRVEIPKPAGGVRPLGIPTVTDRIVQAAAKIVCEPIFEADFLWWRLKRLIKRYGRNLHAGRADAWTRDFFVQAHGLHRLRGTVRYPNQKAA